YFIFHRGHSRPEAYMILRAPMLGGRLKAALHLATEGVLTPFAFEIEHFTIDRQSQPSHCASGCLLPLFCLMVLPPIRQSVPLTGGGREKKVAATNWSKKTNGR